MLYLVKFWNKFTSKPYDYYSTNNEALNWKDMRNNPHSKETEDRHENR